MRISIFLISIVLFSCQTENKSVNNSEKGSVSEEKSEEKLPEFLDILPEIKNKTTEIKVEQSGELGLKIIFKNDLGIEELNINIEKLIPRVSPVAYKNNFHQKLSLYLFEKQLHKIDLRDFESGIGVNRYEIVNPPSSPYWQILGFDEQNKMIVSIAFLVSEKIMTNLFKKVNNLDFENFKNALFISPGNQKIEYNSLRKMGQLFEGKLTYMNQFDFPKNNSMIQKYILRNNKVENLNFYFENNYKVPTNNANGYNDTTILIDQSIREFYYIKGFTYKTCYSLLDTTEQALEIQIDFKTKENKETVRMVMIGVLRDKIPFLENEQMYEGLYLPLGFHAYENIKTSFESVLMMGNNNGLWVDNDYGRNIDGVILYFDKKMKSKIHIWLMSGHGDLPIAHYISILDRLPK